ncbi:hypothetical protein [Cypionkella sp. TWP1-2-1b2]|uniref:hypothetical protein n=1 Tax=Cypionkella sp. TWP1-2-1b2 TaxID=2804675 RepID=UPI003CE84AE9
MQYRHFGRTGWKVSEIAFGAWQSGGDWGLWMMRRRSAGFTMVLSRHQFGG